MIRLARFALLSLAAVAALAASGCNKHEVVHLADTEGIYVSVDGLKYQIQISRILEPSSPEDQAYIRGVSVTEEELEDDELWYGIFMRVENDGDEPAQMAENFIIRDTDGDEFEPLDLDPEENVFLYEPVELAPGSVTPIPNSPSFDNTIRGELLLFKLNASSLGNRPLELEIESPSGGENAIIDVDV
jgi:hypothetical protein